MMLHLADEKTEIQRNEIAPEFTSQDSWPYALHFHARCPHLASCPAFGCLGGFRNAGWDNVTGVILSAAVDFHFNFIFGSFPLHLASVAQFCMDVDTVSPPVSFVVAFSSVLQFSLDLVVTACFTTYHSPCTTDSVTNKRFTTFKKEIPWQF